MQSQANTSVINRICQDGLWVAVSMVLSYVEALMPFYFGAPGIKIGLANMVLLIFVVFGRIKEGILVTLLRIVLSGLLFGSMYSILYSLSGAFCAILVSLICVGITGKTSAKRLERISIIVVSMLAGAVHNLGQLICAFLILRTDGLWYYLPVLILAGTICGMITGIIVRVLKPVYKYIGF